MNNRIIELGKEAGLDMNNTMVGGFPNDSVLAARQFAELIIYECANVAADRDAIDIYEKILDHFGL